MPNTLSVPFFALEMKLSSGGTVSIPVSDSDAVRVNEPLHMLAGKYANLLQKNIPDKGNYLAVLNEFHSGTFAKDYISVKFPKSKNGIGFPEFELTFEYFSQNRDLGFWGIVPVLGTEGFGETEEELKDRLKEAVKLEFIRKKRLADVQNFIPTIWFESSELLSEKISLRIYSPSETDKIQSNKKNELLPKVAQKLTISRKQAFGRDAELNQLEKALKSSFNKNVLLIGPSGVGKTALIWEIVSQAKEREIKEVFWETTASVMIKELTQNTGWQDNIVYLCQELRTKKDFLFLRNFHELFEVGKYEGNEVSMAQYLRSFVQRGDIKIISEITEEELARIDLISPGYSDLFQKIRIGEPKAGELETIISQKVGGIAKHRKVYLKEDGIQEVIRLNRRFTPYAGFPGKPIRFLESLLVNASQEKGKFFLDKDEIIRHFCSETGMPTFLVDPEIPMDLKSVKVRFNNNVFGQENAVEEVANILGTVKTALTKTGKPIASFLFVGPTGVGKTELAKILADFTFGSRKRMIRFDMSEYSNPWSVLRLTGSGYHSDGLLTSAVRRDPFCVLLFDEIEKAHSSFFDLLLQVLSEGRLTDSQGKTVNFCSTIIIMTSNIGAKKLQSGQIGWNKGLDVKEVTEAYKSAVEKYFRPELFNRIDQIIPFEPLTPDTVRFVVEREIEILKKREGIQFRNMDLNIDEEVLDFLAEKGYDSKYGARQLQRTIREKLIIPFAKELNVQDFADRLICNLKTETSEDGIETIKFEVEADPLGFDLLLEQWDRVSNADQVSNLRRKIDRLKEGPTMVRFYNEFDRLENKKKRTGENFWKNPQQGADYSYFLQIIEDARVLSERIEKLEMEISLACLDLGKYGQDYEDQISQWELDLFELKKQVYKRLQTKTDSCDFAIYGRNIEEVLKFYLDLFEKKGFVVNGDLVWFRDSYFNEEITDFEIDKETKEKVPVKKPRKKYLYETWNRNDGFNFKPPVAGDILYGIELELTGDFPFLFLSGERGFQLWKTDSKEGNKVYIHVIRELNETPAAIHRQNFYQVNKARRIIEPNLLTDSELKLNREIPRSGFLDLLVEILEERFREAIEQEIN